MESQSLIPFADIKQMAVAVASSGLFGMKKPEEALSLMLLAQAEGMHPITAARDYDIIQGRPAKKSEAMLRDFIRAGGTVEWHSLSDVEADATFSHPLGGTVRVTWDKNRAMLAELWGKAMWKKYPRQMFRSRVVSEGVRTVYPGATSGLYEVEEVRDFSDKPKDPEPPKTKEVTAEVEPAKEYPSAFADDLPDPMRLAQKPVKVQIKPSVKPVAASPEVDAAENPTSEESPFTKSIHNGALFTKLWVAAAASKWEKDEVRDYVSERFSVPMDKLIPGEIIQVTTVIMENTYREAMEALRVLKSSGD